MLDLTSDPKIETKVVAFNNLIVLAREDAGSNAIIASGGLPIIVDHLQKEKNKEVLLGITRLIASLCKDSMKRSKTVFNQVQYELIAELISYDDQEISTAGALIIQNMILSLTDLENKKTHQRRKVHNPVEFCKLNITVVKLKKNGKIYEIYLNLPNFTFFFKKNLNFSNIGKFFVFS